MQIIILLAIFLTVFASSAWALERLVSFVQVRRRLMAGTGAAAVRDGPSSIIKDQEVRGGFLAWVQSVTSLNDLADRDKIRRLLRQAGFDQPAAAVWFVIVRFGLAIGLPLLFLASQQLAAQPPTTMQLSFGALLWCGAGLVAPRAIVDRLATNRKTELEQQFPDALDLMVVCVEAGLGMEAAFLRVGKEVSESHPRISQELKTLSQELVAGRTRAEALRNLGERTDVAAMKSFAALLIQTDTLGASIGQTLRVYSQEMRETRFSKAEEKAMRIPVLMTIPLVACILPVIITALLLPGMIDMIREGLPALKGVGQ